jgi:uncharacterized protein YhbP (UPF0306 family)
MSLATTAAAGAHAANLFYARDGLALVWVSDPASRHSVEIETEPRVAATVAPDYEDFQDIRGVQIHGTARRVAGAGERSRLLALLERRYPFLAVLADAAPDLREAYASTAVWRLEPLSITLIDNTLGFGHKETLDLAAS